MEFNAYLNTVAPAFEATISKNGDFEKCFQKIQLSKHTGCLRICKSDAEGLLFFIQGSVNGVFCSICDIPASGPDAIDSLFQIWDTFPFQLSYYPLQFELSMRLCRITSCQTIHSGLSTEFVNLHKMMGFLSNTLFSGYVHILFSECQRTLIVAYQDGVEIGCFFWPQIKTPTNQLLRDIKNIVNTIQGSGAVFSVYKKCLQEFRFPQPKIAEPLNRQDAIDLIETCMLITKKELNKLGRSQIFEDLFVDACIELTDTYPFLHPFSGEFQYMQDKLQISEVLKLEMLFASANAILENIFQRNIPLNPNLIQQVDSLVRTAVDETKRDILLSHLDLHMPVFSVLQSSISK
jgi:hypothetical protein